MGELFEPGRQRLQLAEIVPLHSSLGDRAKRRLQKQKQRKKKINKEIKQSISLYICKYSLSLEKPN